MTKSYNCPETGIGCKITGQGKTLLLIHGFAEDHSIWDGAISSLGNAFQLITPDLIGTGISEGIGDFNHSIENHARALKKMLSKLELDEFIVMGHSMGGYVALEMAQLYKDECLGIGLLHSTCFADDELKKASRDRIIKFLETNSSETYLKTAVPVLFHQPEKHAGIIESLIASGSKTPPSTLVAYQKMMKQRTDRSDTLKSIKKPAIIIAGAKDQAVHADQSLKQSYLAPMTSFHLLDNVGHMGMFESPITFHESLRSHLFNFHKD